MKKFLVTAAIVLMTTTTAFSAGTDGTKPVEDLNRALDNYLATGTNTDGVNDADMKPSQDLIEKLNMAVENSNKAMLMNKDCVAGTDQKPSKCHLSILVWYTN